MFHAIREGDFAEIYHEYKINTYEATQSSWHWEKLIFCLCGEQFIDQIAFGHIIVLQKQFGYLSCRLFLSSSDMDNISKTSLTLSKFSDYSLELSLEKKTR